MTGRYKMEYVNDEVSIIIDTEDNHELTAEEITDKLNREARLYEGWKKEALEEAWKNKKLKEEKQLIKHKLIELILNYDEISHDNYHYGLSEAVEGMHESVIALFNDPYNFKMEHYCDDCNYFKEDEEQKKFHCSKFNKTVDEYDLGCDSFEWK